MIEGKPQVRKGTYVYNMCARMFASLCATVGVPSNCVLHPVGLFIFPLYRAHVGLVGTLARGEAGTEKQSDEHERSLHG